MPKPPSPRGKPGRKSPARERDAQIARRYEGGHGAPFSPTTPEAAGPDAPAVEEMRGRDAQDGKTDARRTRREAGADNRGPPEPEDAPPADSAAAPAAADAKGGALSQVKRQRRSHRTVH